MRHIKVIVVVDIDKDDEEKAVHVSLIREGKIRIL